MLGSHQMRTHHRCCYRSCELDAQQSSLTHSKYGWIYIDGCEALTDDSLSLVAMRLRKLVKFEV